MARRLMLTRNRIASVASDQNRLYKYMFIYINHLIIFDCEVIRVRSLLRDRFELFSRNFLIADQRVSNQRMTKAST